MDVIDPRLALAIALATVLAATLAALALRPLLPIDETRYLTVAWEMWRDGEFLVPKLNGLPYPDKPPLLFWSMHFAWALTGLSEAAARLVPGLYAAAQVGLTWLLARRLWPERPAAASLAVLVLAGSTLFALMSTLVMFDTALGAAVLVGLLGIAEHRRGRFARGWLLFGLAVGVGVLAKGPIILVHLLPPALLAPLWWREASRPAWGRWYAGLAGALALGAAVALAWAIPAGVDGGESYRNAIFWGQSAGRMVNAFAHVRPIWFYLEILPLALFPWLVWPPAWRAVRFFRRETDDPMRLLLAWAASAFVILSLISGKQVHYLIPLLPAAALILARLLDALDPRHAGGGTLLPGLLIGLIGIMMTGVELWIASGHAAPLVVAAFPAWFGPALILLGAAVAFAPARHAALALGLAMPAAVVVAEVAARLPFRSYDLQATAQLAATHDGAIAWHGKYAGQITFLGRLTQPVAVLGDDSLAAWAAAHPDGVILSDDGETARAAGLRPIHEQPYRGRVLGIWQANPPAAQ